MTLEELLNTLIQRGWKPFGEWIDRSPYYNCDVGVYERVHWKKIVRFYSKHHKHPKTLRQLVSKESWLWQFVCENGMRPKRVWYEEHHWQRDNRTNWRWMVMESEPEYRLIESALKDESELEDFLLQNIKIWDI